MAIKSRNIFSRWQLAILVATFLFACREEPENYFPYSPVRYELNLVANQYQALRTPGGIVAIQTSELAFAQIGLGGLIIVRDLIVPNSFHVYDLACPVEKTRSILLQIVDDEAICPICNSHYDLLLGNGAPIQGVARRPLQRYIAQHNPIQNKLLIVH